MNGYHRLAAETAVALSGGVYQSWDLRYVDDEGYLYLNGRRRELIRTGGESMSPAEVEEALRDLPGISDVAVVGLPDERWGEVVCAVVVTVPGAAAPESRRYGRTWRSGWSGSSSPRRVVVVQAIPAPRRRARSSAPGSAMRCRHRRRDPAARDMKSRVLGGFWGRSCWLARRACWRMRARMTFILVTLRDAVMRSYAQVMRRPRPDHEHPMGAEPEAPNSESGTRPGFRWWNSLTKTIVGLGAAAGAITAILSLIISIWPKPDPRNRVEFTSVRLAANVPFEEYQQRVTVRPAWHAGALAETTDVPYPVPATAEPTASEEPPAPPETQAPTSTPTADDSASATTSPEPSATGQPFGRTNLPLGEFCQNMELANVPNCETSSVIDQMGNGLVADQPNSASPSLVGAPPPPQDVADSLQQVFEHARTTTTESGGAQPLGVVVTADITLDGLRGQPVQLSWSIWQQGGKSRLFSAWFAEIVAYQFEPGADQETRSADVWVPLPEAIGSYFVRLKVSVQGNPLGSVDSSPFQ